MLCIPVVRNSSQKKLYVDDEIYIAYFIATYTDVPRDETKNCTSICSFIITFLTFLLRCSLVVVVTSAFLLVIIIIIGIEMGSKTCEKLIYNLCPICNITQTYIEDTNDNQNVSGSHAIIQH